MADLGDTVDRIARPVVDEAGLDLVDVRVKGSEGRPRVQVIVDRKGGVDVGTCQDVAKAISRALDEDDPVEGRYTLEVTSPGTDHPLADQRAFDRVEGRLVKAVLRTEDDRTREVVGTVTAAHEDAAELTAADGTVHRVPYADIVKATQELPW